MIEQIRTLLSEFRTHELYAVRAKQSRIPRVLQGVGPGSRATWLNGAPRCPPGVKLAPCPPQPSMLGHLRTLGDETVRHRNLLRLRDELGDVVRFRFGGMTAHLIAHPDLIREVLHTRNREFDKYTRGMFALRLVLGLGLLTNEGESWLRQRRIAQPAFHKKHLASFAERIVDAAEDMCSQWHDGQVIDAHAEMMRVTMRIVGETLLGTDVTDTADSVGSALEVVLDYINERVNALFPLSPRIPTRDNRAFMRASRKLDEVVLAMIDDRRRSQGPSNASGGPDNVDLLQMLMDARDADSGEGMSDTQLRDEVMTMFLAGHETTANALSWALYLLADHPDVDERLHAEVAGALAGAPASHEDMPALPLSKQVVEESLRLYPPAWMTARSSVEDTELGGFFIPKRSLLFISPWVTQRHPDFWDSPSTFDPSRFSEERRSTQHKFAYFPFSAGPRVCIGKGFALMEAQLVLATITRHWRLELAEGSEVTPRPEVTMRPSELRMIVRKR